MPGSPNIPRDVAALANAVWPAARAAEALYALARFAGIPVAAVDAAALPDRYPSDELHTWIEEAAARGQLQADQAFVALDEVDDLVAHGAPALVRLAALDGAPFLAVAGRRGRFARVLGPDQTIHSVPTRTIVAAVRRPFEAQVATGIDEVVDRMTLGDRRRARARAALIADRLKPARFRGCWLLRLPVGAGIRDEARELGVPRRLALLGGAHVVQYALFVVSWWLLGRGVLNGTVDRGWLLGWLLMVLSLVPVRLLGTWQQGLTAITIGAWLRRRLLRGAFLADRQALRAAGAGRLFGVVVEAAAIDALALTGGALAAFSVVEIVAAMTLLWLGAVPLAAPLLAGWLALTAWLAWAYFQRRRTWTTDRFRLSHYLLESMIGHRTRLVQQPEDGRHQHEDEAVERYVDRSQAMDRSNLWLTAFIPRGWLVVAFAAMAPAFATAAEPSRVAISIGAALLGYRALQRLAGGLANLAGAVIAGQAVVGLARAAERREPTAVSAAVSATARESGDVVAQVRDVTFRYRPGGEPILHNCTLTIPRHSRILLEGASGAGKTTFASILAGLQAPESGLVLAGGLDRASLGASGWRRRVVLAPQAHDNFLIGASLAFNLLMGRRWPAEGVDLAEAEAVCRELGLGELLDRMPAGLHQVVGETGWQLSQGERARVFLARALLQMPELLILDEGFSALDSENADRAMRCVGHRVNAVLAIAHP